MALSYTTGCMPANLGGNRVAWLGSFRAHHDQGVRPLHRPRLWRVRRATGNPDILDYFDIEVPAVLDYMNEIQGTHPREWAEAFAFLAVRVN